MHDKFEMFDEQTSGELALPDERGLLRHPQFLGQKRQDRRPLGRARLFSSEILDAVQGMGYEVDWE